MATKKMKDQTAAELTDALDDPRKPNDRAREETSGLLRAQSLGQSGAFLKGRGKDKG